MKRINWTGQVGAGLKTLLMLGAILLSPPYPVLRAQPSGTFRTSYYDVGTSAGVSAAGYGGPGSSGGSGDNTVRIINAAAQNGTMCAMIYVFDDFEELQSCCGCPVTPDGLRTLSVVNDLTFDFGVNKGKLNAGVIRIIPSLLNFTPGNPNPTGTNPPGTNGPNTGTIPEACDPTLGAGNDPFGRSHFTTIQEISPLNAWITHDELIEPGNIAGHPVQSTSVEEFQPTPFDSTEVFNTADRCAFLITNGSGSGVCTCGAGDDAFVPPASPASCPATLPPVTVAARYSASLATSKSCDDCVATCCGRCVRSPAGECFCFEPLS